MNIAFDEINEVRIYVKDTLGVDLENDLIEKYLTALYELAQEKEIKTRGFIKINAKGIAKIIDVMHTVIKKYGLDQGNIVDTVLEFDQTIIKVEDIKVVILQILEKYHKIQHKPKIPFAVLILHELLKDISDTEIKEKIALKEHQDKKNAK